MLFLPSLSLLCTLLICCQSLPTSNIGLGTEELQQSPKTGLSSARVIGDTQPHKVRWKLLTIARLTSHNTRDPQHFLPTGSDGDALLPLFVDLRSCFCGHSNAHIISM